MRVTFALSLDGFDAADPVSRLGEVFCGPVGLLELLETRLGLKTPRPSAALRVAVWLQALREAAAKRDRFYSRSLDADPVGVARTLLKWRDEWICAGWDRRAASSDSIRLRDMADVEQLATEHLPHGPADRTRRVLETLKSTHPDIEKITALDRKEHLPPPWTEILSLLPTEWTAIETRLTPRVPEAQSLLARLRRHVLAEQPADQPPDLTEDDSLLLIEDGSELVLAEWLARWIARRTDKVCLIAGGEGRLLDDALRMLGKPRPGLSSASMARPHLQILPLALRLLWNPPDPQHLFEFLIHPVCPVPGALRHPLATALREQPGIEGPEWKRAIVTAENSIHEQWKGDPHRNAQELKRIRDSLHDWILVERHDPQQGMPSSHVAACCVRVAAWAEARAELTDCPDAERDLFRQAAGQAAELREAVEQTDRLTLRELEGFLEEVVRDGVARPDVVAESGHVRRVRSPGAVIEAHDVVLWWNFRDPGLPAAFPWTERERAQLKSHGAKLGSARRACEQQTRESLRPLLAAGKQLVLVTPRPGDDEEAAVHPLLNRIEAWKNSPLHRTLARNFQHDGAAATISVESLPRRSLPPARRWWKLPKGHPLPQRKQESFSSLNAFIFSPYKWVLQYHARLEGGVLTRTRLGGDSLQSGKLLHRFIGEILRARDLDWRTADEAGVTDWLDQTAVTLLREEGANLLLPGAGANKVRLMSQAQRATWHLILAFRAAKVASILIEDQQPTVPFQGGELGGRLDLIVRNDRGQEAVVDLKLGSRKSREEELQTNTQLQLAVYGALRCPHLGSQWPAHAYGILGEARLLAQDTGFFPTAEVRAPLSAPVGLAACWNSFLDVWKWRRKLLDDGWIELTVGGSEHAVPLPGQPDGNPPVENWEAAKEQDRYNDFATLTRGWEDA